MICPQTNLECQMSVICGDSRGCQVAKRVNTNPPPPPDMAEIERLAGDVSMAMSALLAAVGKMGRGAPKDSPPVSLDEIEGLVDDYGEKKFRNGVSFGSGAPATEWASDARAALMAAIRSLSNSTGE